MKTVDVQEEVDVHEQEEIIPKEKLLSGCEAIAEALVLADVDVITAYPIRPYDTVMNAIEKEIANGAFDAEFIVAESEHSQFEIVKHASSVGARTFTGSSGVGWLYAMEALAVTAGLRLPVVAIVGNRALDDPGAFGCEHNDALLVRDLGWMLNWVESAQESVDTVLMAFRVAEDPKVLLPCAIGMDGAYLTHSQTLVNIPTREQVNEFLPDCDRGDLVLHPDNPISVAPQCNEDWLMEIRMQSDQSMQRTKGIIKKASADFNRIFGRGGDPFLEEYMTEDADVVIVGMGTLAMPVKATIRTLREQGKKVGFVRIKWFRPFPTEELQTALSRFKAIGVIDRDYSFGSPFYGGVVYNELRSAMYSTPEKPPIQGFIAGLGGREVTTENVIEISDTLLKVAETGKVVKQETIWIGVRG